MTEDEISDFINICDQKAEVEGIEQLRDFEKIVTLVSSVDFEVTLGGFLGFLCNSSGDRCIEVVNALNTIGAHEAAESVALLTHLFPDHERISQNEYRQEILKEFTEDELGHFRVLEDRYFAQDPGVRELLYEYIENHV